jgi:hypothetical protein
MQYSPGLAVTLVRPVIRIFDIEFRSIPFRINCRRRDDKLGVVNTTAPAIGGQFRETCYRGVSMIFYCCLRVIYEKWNDSPVYRRAE